MIKYQFNEKGFAGLIGMLVTLALICFFVYYMMNTYFKAQVSLPESVVIDPGPGNSPANYQSIITNTRNKVEDINKKSMDSLKQVEESLQ